MAARKTKEKKSTVPELEAQQTGVCSVVKALESGGTGQGKLDCLRELVNELSDRCENAKDADDLSKEAQAKAERAGVLAAVACGKASGWSSQTLAKANKFAGIEEEDTTDGGE